MSSEVPPFPITTTYNESAWIQDTGSGLTQVQADGRYLSKLVASTAQGIISFVLGLKSNLITVYSGNTLTIGEGGGGTKTVSLYYPYLAVALLDPADNTALIPSTSWVNSWFANILNTTSLVWILGQTFNAGIQTNTINPTTASGTIQIGQTGVISLGNPSSRLDVSCATNILTGTDASSFCNVLTGTMLAGTVAGQVNILTGSHNATASGGNINMRSGNCKGTATIGNSLSTLTMNAGTINLNSPLTVGYEYAFTQGTGNTPYITATAVGSNTKIGYAYYTPLVTVVNAPLNGVAVARQVLTVPRGVYQVSWTFGVNNNNTVGFAGYVITGVDIPINSTSGSWGAGFNFYQTGYAETKGSITTGSLFTGSVTVIIGGSSTHNTIGITGTFGSVAFSAVGDINSSMSVVRIA